MPELSEMAASAASGTREARKNHARENAWYPRNPDLEDIGDIVSDLAKAALARVLPPRQRTSNTIQTGRRVSLSILGIAIYYALSSRATNELSDRRWKRAQAVSEDVHKSGRLKTRRSAAVRLQRFSRDQS